MGSVVFLTTHVARGSLVAAWFTGVLAVLLVGLWFMLPLVMRAR